MIYSLNLDIMCLVFLIYYYYYLNIEVKVIYQTKAFLLLSLCNKVYGVIQARKQDKVTSEYLYDWLYMVKMILLFYVVFDDIFSREYLTCLQSQ